MGSHPGSTEKAAAVPHALQGFVKSCALLQGPQRIHSSGLVRHEGAADRPVSNVTVK